MGQALNIDVMLDDGYGVATRCVADVTGGHSFLSAHTQALSEVKLLVLSGSGPTGTR